MTICPVTVAGRDAAKTEPMREWDRHYSHPGLSEAMPASKK